jgi:hypothetical protein
MGNFLRLKLEQCGDVGTAKDFLITNTDAILRDKTILIPIGVADKDRFSEIRKILIEYLLEFGLFLKSIIIIEPDKESSEPLVELLFSDCREDWIQYSNKLSIKNKTSLAPENHPSSLVRIFIIHGLRHFLFMKKRDDVLLNQKGRRYVPLGDIASCSNGKSIPVKDSYETADKATVYKCLSPQKILKNRVIDANTPIESKMFDEKKDSTSQELKLSNCILLKNHFYRFDLAGFSEGAAIVTDTINCRVEKSLHIIELSPYIDKRYLSFLLCYILFCKNFHDQVIHFKETYLKITIDDLRRVVVPDPYELKKMKSDNYVSALEATIEHCRTLLKNDPGRVITVEDIEAGFAKSIGGTFL